MSDFIRARTEEQFNQRREMILSACEQIYSEQGFLGVTFNTVAEKTSFTRPALYNYYRNKEEMLMDLLKKQYSVWDEKIRKDLDRKENLTREEFCHIVSDNVSKSEKMFQLLGDVFLIEKGCDAENISELKKGLYDTRDLMASTIRRMFPKTTDSKIENFLDNCTILIFGIYPYTHMQSNQIEALRNVAPNEAIPEMRSMFFRSLMSATEGFLNDRD